MPGFVRATAARENGVRGCFMFPVRIGDRVEIVLEFFSREKAELSEALLELMAYVADRLAITITDHAQRERVRSLMAALDGIASGLADTTMQVEAGARTVLAVAETVDERPHSTTTMALMTIAFARHSASISFTARATLRISGKVATCVKA